MKSKNTKDPSVEHERAITEYFAFDNARLSKSSGAHWIDHGVDVGTNTLVIDAKYTSKKSIRIGKDDWVKLALSSARSARMPAVVYRMQNEYDKRDKLDLILLDLHDFAELLEMFHEMRKRLDELDQH